MLDNKYLMQMESEIRFIQVDATGEKDIHLVKEWAGDVCRSKLVNNSKADAKVREVVLFKGAMPLKAATPFYGEGYNMLSQYEGTLEALKDAGSFNDHSHYRMPETEGFRTVYNLMLLSPEESPYILMAFTSCRRFRGEIRFSANKLEIVLDTEGLVLKPGQIWELEEFFISADKDKNRLFEQLAEKINVNHPKLAFSEPPLGWCSWYCYGPNVTEQDVFDNMDAIGKALPQMEYIQIDDGYQAYMGDWLIPGASFTDDNNCLIVYAFNWGDSCTDIDINLSGMYRIEDFWTGEDLGLHSGEMAVCGLPPHSARAFICKQEK